MKKTVALAFALVLGAAGTSFADLAYASTAATVSASTNAGGATVSNGANITGVADGSSASFLDNGAAGSHAADITVHSNFAPGPEVGLYVYFGSSVINATGHKFKSLTYTDSGGNTATILADQDLSLSDNTQFGTPGTGISYDKRFFLNSNNAGAYALVGAFNFNNIVSLDLKISYVTTGSFTSGQMVFAIDAISNPEPGTIALFALGAAGLGGFAWKRRKARVSARTSV